MHHDELWQLYQKNGEPIVGAGWDSARDNPKGDDPEIVGLAVVFIYRHNQKGELEFLWQRRSEKVDRFPGFWDFSAGGHINLGETVVEGAVREAREEIGAEISEDELYFVTMRPFDSHRLAWVFLVDYTDKEEKFHFDDEEVSEVKWVKYDGMDEFRHNFAKPPLQKDELTPSCVKTWLEMHGDI